MQAGYSARQTPSLNVISDNQIDELIEAGLIVLERTGVKINHPEALTLLTDSGASVSGDRVKTPRWLVQKALAQAPKGIMIYDREGQPAMRLSGGRSYFGSSTASPNIVDAETGERHRTTLRDIQQGALVADALPHIDFIMPFGTAQDVPGLVGDVYEFLTLMGVTAKPIVFCGYSGLGVRKVLEMAAHVAGGRDRLREAPFVLPYPEPITPLHFPHEVVARMLAAAEFGAPQVNAGSQALGQTAPGAMAGCLVMGLAEAFFSILLNQLKSPGAPCFLATAAPGVDHRSGAAYHASPGLCLTLAANAQVARRLGLPTWGLAGATDSKTLDAQAGAESALTLVTQALAGVTLIHDVGYMEAGMVCSAAMMVLGDEIISWVKQFMKGLDVSAETLALEAINQAGPAGNFLALKHTVKHFKSESWFHGLFQKDIYESWRAAGSLDCEKRAYLRLKKILETHRPKPVKDSLMDDLKRMVREAEKEILDL